MKIDSRLLFLNMVNIENKPTPPKKKKKLYVNDEIRLVWCKESLWEYFSLFVNALGYPLFSNLKTWVTQIVTRIFHLIPIQLVQQIDIDVSCAKAIMNDVSTLKGSAFIVVGQYSSS